MRVASKKSGRWSWLWLTLLLAACRPSPTPGPVRPAAAPASASGLTARGALALAKPEAQAWNAGALLAEILSGEDIGAGGTSDYWEFQFVEPGMRKKYVVVVQARRVKQAQEGRLAGPLTALPADWLDSQAAYEKSVAAFFAHHPDPQSFQPAWLVCDSRYASTPHWAMLFTQPRHLPVGAMIDARSGDYLGEISR